MTLTHKKPPAPRRFKPYPAYKDSGVEWLGEIPAHWEVYALKRWARRIQTGTTPPTSETRYYEDGVIPWYGPGSFTDDLPLAVPSKLIAKSAVRDGVARVFEAGSVVVVTIGATIGKVAYMQSVGSCNQQITGITLDLERVYPKYAAYQLKCLEPVLRGIAPNTTLPILDQEEVGYLPVAISPSVEQRAIAAFLDRETARIDALVAKKERLIELLQEKRTALITRAVTKGLDPTVPMKDSGVEWLGEIPAHWDLISLKRVAGIRYGLGEPPQLLPNGLPFIRATDVSRGRIIGTDMQFVDPQDVPWNRDPILRNGDIIVVRSGAYTGDSAIIPLEYDGAIAGYDMVVRLRRGHARFIAWALLSRYVLEAQIELESTRAAQPHLNAEELGATALVLPTEPEQRSIAAFLDLETARIDTLVAKVRDVIDRLKELRSALISAAVTGKIDVREEDAA